MRWILLVLAGLLAVSAIQLLRLHLEAGSAYPEDSSLRADASGAKVLFESLSRLPGLTVRRNFLPLERLGADETGSAILFLGIEAWLLTHPREPLFDQLERIAQRGNRLVITLRPFSSGTLPNAMKHAVRWGVALGLEMHDEESGDLYLVLSPDWRVLDQRGKLALTAERNLGKGTLVLSADAEAFRNSGLAATRRPALLARAIGPNRNVIFDEAHAGMVEAGSIVGLARRFRLQGLAAGLAICALLFLWKNAASFPPAQSAPERDAVAGRTSLSGLATLLRRNIPRNELAPLCWAEWVKGGAREIPAWKQERAAAVAAREAADPAQAIREIRSILNAKGPT